jgi:4-azaleucine resistance transporter AzlC
MAARTETPDSATGLKPIIGDESTLPVEDLPPARESELMAGVRATLPFAISLVPFMSVYGLLMREAGIPAWTAQAMSVLVFSGAQLVVAQMLLGGVPGLVIVASAGTMNLRHTLYSASLASHIKQLSIFWRMVLAYLLTDEVFAVGIVHYQRPGNPAHKHWFLLGGGLGLWIAAQVGTAAGTLAGSAIPSSWSLDFLPTLIFIALLVEAIRDRATLLAAFSAGLLATIAAGAPLKLSVLAATLVGIGVGVAVEIRAARATRRVPS